MQVGSPPRTDVQPLRIGACTIVADLRVFDRAALLAKLPDSSVRLKHAADAELILRLYIAFGIEGFRHIIGDYSFVIHDAGKQELLCVRDVFGIRPFYWQERDGRMFFASEPRGILAHPDADREVNEDFVIRLLAGLPPDPQATAHRAVRILPAGHVLRVSRNSISLFRYTAPVIPDVMRSGTSNDSLEAFRETLVEAVRCRIDGLPIVASELSGGLDSSAVTCIAAGLLHDPDRIHAFSNVLPDRHSPSLWDESVRINEVLQHVGIRHIHRVSDSGRTDFLSAVDLDLDVNGGVEYMTSMWLEPFRRIMEAQRINVVLSGFLGDEVATHSGRNHWVDLADEGRYLAFLQASLREGRYEQPFRRIFRAIVPDRLVDFFRRVVDSPLRTYIKPGLGTSIPGSLTDRPPAGRFPHKRHLLFSTTRPLVARRFQSEALYGIRHRLESRYPMADLRLVELVLSLPASVIGHPQIDRYLYRSSMQHIVPESVRLRRDKDVPAGIFYLEENLRWNQSVRDWVMTLRKHSNDPLLDLVDFDRVMADLDPAQPANQWRGTFYPTMPFHLQALLRFCERRSTGA